MMRMDDRAGAATSRGRIAGACLAIIAAATAVIHFAVAGGHFAQYWVYGVFMLVTAWLQLAWSAAIVARPSRPLLWAGTALNTAVIVVYVVTRTAGDVIGPGRGSAEPFGFGDALCTVLEAVVVAGSLWLLASRADRPARRGQLVTASVGTGAVTAVLLSIALIAGGPDMVMAARPVAHAKAGSHLQAAMPGMGRAAAAHVSLATSSPGGDITMPDPAMQMPPGMRMASSRACDARPTPAQQRAAVRLVDASWKGARKYRSLAAAKAAGYRPITPAGLPVVHYLDVSAYLASSLSGHVLDTARPQSLVYANTPRGAVLVAAMYITAPHGPTPQPGGCLTQWHVHTNLCLAGGIGVVGLVSAAHPTCPAGSVNRVTPPMMHIWFVPVPGGPTAIDASDAQVVRAAERVRSPRNGTA